jgi:hypothetical protein
MGLDPSEVAKFANLERELQARAPATDLVAK